MIHKDEPSSQESKDLVPGRISMCPAEGRPFARDNLHSGDRPSTASVPREDLFYWTCGGHLVCLFIFKEENFKSICLILDCC